MSYKNLLFIFKVFLKQVSHLEKNKTLECLFCILKQKILILQAFLKLKT